MSGCRGGCGDGRPMPQGANPPQAGAGRGNYWADTLSEDNETRLHGANWLKMVGLNPPGTLAGPGGCRGGCGGGHHPAYPGAQVFPTCDQYNDRPQGPTDETIRCASCWWVQNILPQDTSYGLGGFMDAGLSHGGRRVPGFGIGAGSASVYAQLSAAQQAWVSAALLAWYNDSATQSWLSSGQGSGTCPSINASSPASAYAQCFQAWYNASLPQGSASQLPLDGTIDTTTLGALMGSAASSTTWGTAANVAAGCPNSCAVNIASCPSGQTMNASGVCVCPGGAMPNAQGQCAAAPATTTSSNTAMYVAAGAAVLVLGGAAIYAVKRKRKRAA